MIPLFKTHYSIGQSLLTPKKCFELAKDENEIVFVEDSFGGFRAIKKLAEEHEKPLRFGIRLNCNYADNKASKVVLFAKNNEGLVELREIYTRAQTKGGVWKYDKGSLKNLLLCIPFYDSYLHKGIHNFGVYDLPVADQWHFVESHNHPYDYQIQRKIDRLQVPTQKVCTILYEKYDNFVEFQFYKSTCNRSGGKHPTVGKPELEDCGCNTFCWQYYEDSKK